MSVHHRLSSALARIVGPANILPLSEQDRRVEAERTMAKIRIGVVVLYAVAATVRPGDSTPATWAIFGLIAVAAVISVIVSRNEEHAVPGIDVVLTALDCGVFLAILANNTSDPQDVVYIAGILPALEGALRWARRGGVIVGSVMALFISGWTVWIMQQAGQPVLAEQPILRGGSIAVVGWAIGSIVASLEEQQVALQLALDSARDPVLTVDVGGRVLSANEAAEQVFQRSTDDLVGHPLASLLDDGSPRDGRPTIGTPGGPTSGDVEVRCGAVHRWIEFQLIPIADLGISYARCRDVTDRHETTQLLAHQALHDPLTDLPNRRQLATNLARAVVATPAAVTLLYIDLDGFKAVNDGFGHDAGDELLRQASARMRNCVRETDLVARLAGDEFCVLLSDVDADELRSMSNRLCTVLHEPFRLRSGLHQVAASIGAVRHQPDETPEQLLHRADRAMYIAKSAGGNRVHPTVLRSAV